MQSDSLPEDDEDEDQDEDEDEDDESSSELEDEEELIHSPGADPEDTFAASVK